jgi:hypothetical protein
MAIAMAVCVPDPPLRCTLAHRGFVMLGEQLFRRAEADGTPVMVVTLGEREAVRRCGRCNANSASPTMRRTAKCWR